MVQATGAPIAEYFAALDDPRIDRTKRHKLLDIVTIALCATICGADSWVDIELFGNCKEEWFKSFLELPNGIPSHDTFGDVFARLDPEQFQRCFMEWVQAVAQVTQGEVVAIDGKTVRRSHDRTLGKKAIHMVNVWACPMAWRWARPRWTRSPMKSPPSPSCYSCWSSPVASSPSTPAARGR